ncbi:MAG TPA: HTTM domain-containing protein [Polyangiaceae bacterium]|nr:HTTM domain-containing protein [Polyangiaceae bacterium]
MTEPDAPDAPETAAGPGDTPTAPTPEAAPKRARQPFGAFLRETYGVADPRSLGLFRIALATLLFFDVLRRWPDIEAHYANTGWLTNHYMLFRPMSDHLFSLYLACTTPGEVKTLMLFHLAVCVFLALGWHTRVMQVLAAVMLVSINSRNIMLENGGWVVLTLLTVWSMFLPLGRRFSIDALCASFRARRETTVEALNDRAAPERDTRPVVSLAVAALILQWIVIYYFNVVHKTGHEWRDGTAVYYFFQQDRMVTMLGGWLRDYIPVLGYKSMTYSALAMEAMIALLLAAPFRTSFFRMVAWGLCCALHLSIDAVVQLGPFSWAMVTMFWALIPREAWDEWGPKLAARWPERELCFDAQSGFWLAFCRVVKRFDVLDRVHFRAVTPALSEEETAEPEGGEGEKDPARPGERLARAVGETLVVRDPKRKKVFRGLRALFRLGDAVPFGAVLTFPARLPLLGTAIERRLERASASSGEADAYFELEGLPGSAEVHPSEPTPASVFLRRVVNFAREGAIVLVMVSCGSQVLIENRAVPKFLKVEHRPDWMASIVIYPRLFQGWSMFAPSPPSDDGRVVVDGVTKDGRHLDPLTGEAPSFDVQPKGGFRMNQIWGDFHRRIGEQRFEGYLEGVRDMLRNYHQITHRPEDELVSFTAYFVSEHIPPPGGKHAPASRREILSWTSDSAPPKQPQRPARGRFHR